MKMNQLNKQYGVDVSEHNGIVNWQEVRDAGIEFAIIRLGYGRGHLDSQFYHNVNGALNAGISIGVYYYSYAQNCNDAIEEAAFATHILNDCGLVPARLTMGLWYDAEEAPYWDTQQITNRCSAFINTAWQAGYAYAGVYANFDWWTHHIDGTQLMCPKWCAQYNSSCDLPSAHMWQYTDSLRIGEKMFDGDVFWS